MKSAVFTNPALCTWSPQRWLGAQLRQLLTLGLLAGGCGGDNRLRPCDIREPSCQFDTFLAVQDVRGAIWDPWLSPPPMRVISEAQYREEVRATAERALQDSGGRDFQTEAFKLLRMIDPDEAPDTATEFTVASVAAYYDARTRDVTIIDHGDAGNLNAAVQTLAHELVHAAQDRDVGFGRLYRDANTSNAANAVSALLEGDATVYGLLIDAKQIDLPKGRIDWRVLSGWSEDIRDRVYEDPSPYRPANAELVYPLGGFYVAQTYLAGGPLAVRRLFDNPPHDMVRFVAGRGSEADVARPAFQCGAPVAPQGLSQVLSDELGAVSAYAFATRAFLTEAEAWASAQAWLGDRFHVYASREAENQALAVVWVLRLRDEASARQWQVALQRASALQHVQTLLRGDTLHLFVGDGVDPSYDAWTQCSKR